MKVLLVAGSFISDSRKSDEKSEEWVKANDFIRKVRNLEN